MSRASEKLIRKALVVVVWSPGPGDSRKKILVLRVVPDRGAFWQTVTGGVEAGEGFAEAAAREATEETGLRFERQPQYLGLEQSFPSRWGPPALEQAFFLPLFSPSPPSVTLDGKEHDACEWVTPEEAAARVKFDFNRQAILRAASGLPPLLLTRRGAFLQEGEEITHERTAELFHRSLRREGDGHYTVHCEGESLDVILEDNPRYVRAYARDTGLVTLSDGTKEKLKPESLRVREDNSLVCTVENGWEATFLSGAYYEIAKDIRESGAGKYLLHFLGRDHELAVPR